MVWIAFNPGNRNLCWNNLLDNAIKFTKKGQIKFGCKIINNNLKVYVEDTGVGINPENIDSIFQRFTQEEKELSNKIGGLGLGLSIAQENAKLIDAQLSVESIKREGTSFYLTLPINREC